VQVVEAGGLHAGAVRRESRDTDGGPEDSGIDSGGPAVSDHAPGTHQVPRRLVRWIDDLSDVRISLYMLATAIVAGVVIYAVDRGLLG